MSKIIYLITNPSMPDLVKIGQTSDLEERMRSLYNSSTPVPFECFYACEVDDPKEIEKRLHNAFGDNNPKKGQPLGNPFPGHSQKGRPFKPPKTKDLLDF